MCAQYVRLVCALAVRRGIGYNAAMLMRCRQFLLACLLIDVLMLPAAADAARPALPAASPRIHALPLADSSVPVDLRLAIVTHDWDTVTYLDELPGLQTLRDGASIRWSINTPPTPSTAPGRLEQRVERVGDDLIVDITLPPPGAHPPAGIYLILSVQASAFAGGSFRLDELSGDLPLVPASTPHLRMREATQCTLWSPGHTTGVAVSSAEPIRLLVQDGRRWGPEFSVLATLAEGEEPGAPPVTRRLVLSALGRPEQRRAASLLLSPDRREGRFEGFGGNFAFGLDDGVADTVRRQLRPPVARIRMHLDDLHAPPAGGGDLHAAWLRMLLAADRPWTELWQNLTLAADLHRQRSRLQISTWRVPAWLLDAPIQHDQNVIPRRHYAAFAGMVAAYLDFLRQSRGVIPETFSFNEPDWGANVIFTPEEYRDALLAVTEAFHRHGISTRLMLGELASARDGTPYLTPALTNQTLLSQAAGISFHAWGGAAAADYTAWRRRAVALGLPLFVGEIGADPNWRTVALHGYDYALRELALYHDVLLHARPASVLYWEYGSSYSLLPPRPRGGWTVASERLSFQRQWTALTPPGADYVAVQTTADTLRPVAFTFDRQGERHITLHIANLGAPTALAIAGLPEGIDRLHRWLTARGAFSRREADLSLAGGAGRLELPAESLTTLTTLADNP